MKGKMLSLLTVLLCYATPALASYQASPACMHDLESNFFDNTTVSQALSLHRVDPGSWTPIYEDLRYYSRDARRLVEAEAKHMNPNPLYNPFDPVKAEEILMRVLFNIFANTCLQHQVTNQGDIQEMFGFIRDHNKKRIDACFMVKKKR